MLSRKQDVKTRLEEFGFTAQLLRYRCLSPSKKVEEESDISDWPFGNSPWDETVLAADFDLSQEIPPIVNSWPD